MSFTFMEGLEVGSWNLYLTTTTFRYQNVWLVNNNENKKGEEKVENKANELPSPKYRS